MYIRLSISVENIHKTHHITEISWIYHVIASNSFIIRQFFIFLLFFELSNCCRCDTTHLYVFVYLRQLLKFVEISFANICINAIFERIKSYEEEKTRSKVDQSLCFESKNFICLKNRLFIFEALKTLNILKNIRKSSKIIKIIKNRMFFFFLSFSIII
jgi:hypothetical protein